MKKLFFDIETLPADEEKYEILRELYEKKVEKDNLRKVKAGKKPEEASEEGFQDYVMGTALAGEFGRIFCIAYGVDNGSIEVLTGDETEMLKKFWKIAADTDLFVGHNIFDFDLRFLIKRSIIHRVKPLALSFAKYRNEPIFDTQQVWDNWNSRDSVSLHKLARALGLESHKSGELDGSKVYEFWKAGRDNEIIQYCKKDVELTRKIYKRMVFEK